MEFMADGQYRREPNVEEIRVYPIIQSRSYGFVTNNENRLLDIVRETMGDTTSPWVLKPTEWILVQTDRAYLDIKGPMQAQYAILASDGSIMSTSWSGNNILNDKYDVNLLTPGTKVWPARDDAVAVRTDEPERIEPFSIEQAIQYGPEDVARLLEMYETAHANYQHTQDLLRHSERKISYRAGVHEKKFEISSNKRRKLERRGRKERKDLILEYFSARLRGD